MSIFYISPDELPALPQPDEAQVLLDFDGTISRADVLDELINRFAVDDSWKKIEQQWQAGMIGSYECLKAEFALLRVQPKELGAFLDKIPLDPGVEPLFELLSTFQVPVAILSDGIDYFIRRLLSRLGLENVTLRSNSIIHRDDRLELQCPCVNLACEVAAAHCKCNSAKLLHQPGREIIYVGDGRSDLCPARKASFVFAKNVLANTLRHEGIPYIPFSSLHDVVDALSLAWEPRPVPPVPEESSSCRRGG